MRALARSQRVTVFVTLLAAYKALLARYARQSDVIVGTVVANRDRAEFEALIGFVVNLVVLRTDLGADPRFADILQRIHKGVLDAYAHHEVPFEALVDVLQPQRDTSRSPLFQVAFDMRDPEITRSPTDRDPASSTSSGAPRRTFVERCEPSLTTASATSAPALRARSTMVAPRSSRDC